MNEKRTVLQVNRTVFLFVVVVVVVVFFFFLLEQTQPDAIIA